MGLDRDLLISSATQLSRRIRRGELRSKEVVENHIGLIDQLNPRLNGLVANLFESALESAKEIDQHLESHRETSEDSPLLGIPFSVKEFISTKEMPNSGGLFKLKERVAEDDAPSVARLRRLGSIPLGVSNVSEMGLWLESVNYNYGRTSNCYDLTRTSGGSSGGEGALVGSGSVPFGLGSDLGGSIRIPAFFNGVFGHKPSGRMVPNTGHFPKPESGTFPYMSIGPLARRAEDLFPILQTLAGPDGSDPSCRRFPLKDPKGVSFRGLKVFVVKDNGKDAVDKDLLTAQNEAALALKARGAKVVSIEEKRLSRSRDYWSALMTSSSDLTLENYLNQLEGMNLPTELVRWASGRSMHTWPILTFCLLEKFMRAQPSKIKRDAAEALELKKEWSEMLGDDGILLYPPFPTYAPKHGVMMTRPFDWVYSGIFNVLEFAVTAIPLGLNSKGLPLGVQAAVTPGNDHLALATALALEEDFGGWVPPKIFEELFEKKPIKTSNWSLLSALTQW
jgi:fatty acid amide hydrolase 2